MNNPGTVLSTLENNIDLLWGAAEIGRANGVTQRRAFFLLENGDIPSTKIGGRWCSSRTVLNQFFQSALGAA